jgi:hypothetical protein
MLARSASRITLFPRTVKIKVPRDSAVYGAGFWLTKSSASENNQKTKPHVPCTGKWGLRVSRLLDLRAVSGSKSDTPTRAKNSEGMILKSPGNVKEFK